MAVTFDTAGLLPRQIDRINLMISERKYDANKARALAAEFKKKNVANKTVIPTSTQAEVPAPVQLTPSGQPENTTGPTVVTETGGVNYEELLNDIKQPSSADSFAKAYDSSLALSTRDFAKNKALDLETQKQELANRGIPYDPANEGSLYGRTIQGINTQYNDKLLDAQNNATTQATQVQSTQAGIDNENSKNILAAAGLAAGANGFVYDKQTNAKLSREEIAARIKIANASRSGGGGGGKSGGSSSGSGFSIGGTITE